MLVGGSPPNPLYNVSTETLFTDTVKKGIAIEWRTEPENIK